MERMRNVLRHFLPVEPSPGSSHNQTLKASQCICVVNANNASLPQIVLKTLVDPSRRRFLSLESTESGIASMSAVDKA